MAKENPLKSLVSHIATASSTLIGIMGVLATIVKLFSIDQYLIGMGRTGEILLGMLAAVIAGAAAVFVDKAIVKKRLNEDNDD